MPMMPVFSALPTPVWSHYALIGLVGTWLVSEALYPRQVGPDRSRDRYSSEVMGLSLLLNLLVLYLLVRWRIGTAAWRPDLLAAAGTMLATFGTALRFGAILTLGRYFTSAVVIQAAQPLIRHGPFRWLRHPGYAGNLFFGLGIGLMLANPPGCLFYALSHGLAMHYRIRVEEQALQSAFGATYDDYARRTWRMVPFLY